MAKQILTAQRLREILRYDPLTGIFTWRASRGRMAKAGAVAGSLDRSGYVCIGTCGRLHFAHRLAWLYITGEWPADSIDHIDTEKTNNKWSNLRQATYAQNSQNKRRARIDNKCGLLGASPHKNRWRATIKINRKRVHIGVFDTPELAHAAYLAAKAELHPYQTLLEVRHDEA